jgi:ubiquinone/menaquinone biosynthesis C-methylase UbiE
MDLNVGCGPDEWGDIRLDISKTYHRHKVKLNVRGDAQNLPFRDKVFEKTKASHILEHLPRWKKALEEWCRVTVNEIEIEIPIDVGLTRRQVFAEILSFTNFYRVLILPKRRREHLWKLNPQVIIRELEKHGFKARFETVKVPLIRFLSYGRKSKFLPFKVLNQKLVIGLSYRLNCKQPQNGCFLVWHK